MTVIGLESCSI